MANLHYKSNILLWNAIYLTQNTSRNADDKEIIRFTIMEARFGAYGYLYDLQEVVSVELKIVVD